MFTELAENCQSKMCYSKLEHNHLVKLKIGKVQSIEYQGVERCLQALIHLHFDYY